MKPTGGIDGTGNVIVVEHTTDNNLMKFRFANATVKMLAAEEDFTLNGKSFRAGSFIIPSADRGKLREQFIDTLRRHPRHMDMARRLSLRLGLLHALGDPVPQVLDRGGADAELDEMKRHIGIASAIPGHHASTGGRAISYHRSLWAVQAAPELVHAISAAQARPSSRPWARAAD